jgi:hypothetical protein
MKWGQVNAVKLAQLTGLRARMQLAQDCIDLLLAETLLGKSAP